MKKRKEKTKIETKETRKEATTKESINSRKIQMVSVKRIT
jgi:hypothetical protein